jgi:peptide chain release factor 1
MMQNFLCKIYIQHIKSLQSGGIFELSGDNVVKAKIGWNSVSFIVTGEKALSLFSHEIGGHRIQRVPPTETKGRIQTSTVTVSVITKSNKQEVEINEIDLRYDFFRGRGNGGQKRNKTDSCVRLTHIPSGIVVVAQRERSQPQNKQIALRELKKRLEEMQTSASHNENSKALKEQRKSGMRGDKIRTYRFQEDTITNHKNNKKIKKIDKFMKGNIEIIW